MVHPADGLVWKNFDEKHPKFAFEVRNVRFRLSIDGFTPYSFNTPPYTCRPVFVFPYNLPPGLVMRGQYIFFTLVIPGSKSPGRDIGISCSLWWMN
jgi:Transposase family tnp2